MPVQLVKTKGAGTEVGSYGEMIGMSQIEDIPQIDTAKMQELMTTAIENISSQTQSAISDYTETVGLGRQDSINYFNQANAATTKAVEELEASPYTQAGNLAMQELIDFTGANPDANSADIMSRLENLPGYQFQLQQGQQAMERSLAAKGLSTSGNALAAATEYGQGYAQNAYQGHLQNLSTIAGLSSPFQQALTQSRLAQGAQLSGQGQFLGQQALTAAQAPLSAAMQTAGQTGDIAKQQGLLEFDAAKVNQQTQLQTAMANQQAKLAIFKEAPKKPAQYKWGYR